MTKELTEKQQAFVDALFGDAKGNMNEALRMAGYAKGTASSTVIDSIPAGELEERVRKLQAKQAMRALFAVQEILEDPTDLGNREKLAAAKDILDRNGFKPSDKVEISTGEDKLSFMLPIKDNEKKTFKH